MKLHPRIGEVVTRKGSPLPRLVIEIREHWHDAGDGTRFPEGVLVSTCLVARSGVRRDLERDPPADLAYYTKAAAPAEKTKKKTKKKGKKND